jgi:hypothetical protein
MERVKSLSGPVAACCYWSGIVGAGRGSSSIAVIIPPPRRTDGRVIPNNPAEVLAVPLTARDLQNLDCIVFDPVPFYRDCVRLANLLSRYGWARGRYPVGEISSSQSSMLRLATTVGSY